MPPENLLAYAIILGLGLGLAWLIRAIIEEGDR